MDDSQPSPPLHSVLAQFKGKGYVIAPAGYGKTHLIASAVKEASRRQLVLTHTYAGVNSIRTKMQLLRIPQSLYQVDTIASWALRTCLHYPKTSSWKKEQPQRDEWTRLYATCTSLLDRPFLQRVVKCSYGGLYVDEYQDCSSGQHELIEALSKLVPSRLLGDPMQAIFDFDEQPIDWEVSVFPTYEKLGELDKPWRWEMAGQHALGQWLDHVRGMLASNKKIPLSGGLPKGVYRRLVDLNNFDTPGRLSVFLSKLDSSDSVIAIHSGNQQSKNKTHKLAQSLAGKFSSLEEVEGKDLHSFIKKIVKAKSARDRLLLVVEFAKKCCVAVDSVLAAPTKRGLVARITKATRSPELVRAANRYLETESCQDMAAFLRLILEQPDVKLFRRDLFYRLMSVLRILNENPGLTLLEAASRYQFKFRNEGRPIRHNKLIGTTLLVKGLEYDHAIVLEADAMSPKDLYVALTRGAKSVTLVTLSSEVPK